MAILTDDLEVPCALCAERLRVHNPLADVLEELRREEAVDSAPNEPTLPWEPSEQASELQ